jgi:hypothetical protein
MAQAGMECVFGGRVAAGIRTQAFSRSFAFFGAPWAGTGCCNGAEREHGGKARRFIVQSKGGAQGIAKEAGFGGSAHKQ